MFICLLRCPRRIFLYSVPTMCRATIKLVSICSFLLICVLCLLRCSKNFSVKFGSDDVFCYNQASLQCVKCGPLNSFRETFTVVLEELAAICSVQTVCVLDQASLQCVQFNEPFNVVLEESTVCVLLCSQASSQCVQCGRFKEPFMVVLEELELAVFGSDSMCPGSSFVLMRSNATSRLLTWSSKKWLHRH